MKRFAAALALALSALPTANAVAADPPLPPTEVAQHVTLKEAAAAGILDLRPKGGYGGDTVAVDLAGAQVPGKPVKATVRIEFLGKQKSGAAWPQSKADAIAAAIEKQYKGMKSSDGTPFEVDVVAVAREGDDPETGGTPGWHQIELADRPRASDANVVSGKPFGPNGEKSGNWGTNEAGSTWAHETGHLLGLPDRYLALKPVWIGPGGKTVKLPEFKGDKTNIKQLDAWQAEIDKKVGELNKKFGKGDWFPGTPKGRENDIMADGTGLPHSKQLALDDLDALVAGAGVHVRANPGDVLLNKNGAEQNMVVGGGFDLFAPAGGNAHRDGLWAYCADLHRRTPTTASRFDVLGPAGELSGSYPQYAALQKVTEEIDRRHETFFVAGPPGATEAVWAVTDAREPRDDQEREILASAGVTYDREFFSGSPHFDNPNAGGAATAAVTPTGVEPSVPADRSRAPVEGDPFVLPAPRGSRLWLSSRKVPAGRRASLRLLSYQEGSATRVSITLLRARRPVGAAPLAQLTIPVGADARTVRLPKLRAGSYRLLIADANGGTRTLSFKAVKAKKRRR